MVTGLSAAEAAATLDRDPGVLRLHAQPIVDTTTGEVAGYELLTRLPEQWRVGPEEVFLAAERAGTSPRLSAHVVRQAVLLRDALPARTFLTVNCSPSDFTHPLVLDTLASLDLRRVFVELTELAWPEDAQTVLRAADLVRAQGGRIAADDVGAGYAGLLELIRLRPELVKVDRQIVQRMGRDVAATALIGMLGSLADRLDAWVVAEGVEDQSQLSQLVGLHVPLVQGYYLGRPERPWRTGEHVEEVRRWARARDSERTLAVFQRAPIAGELVRGDLGEVIGVLVDTEEGSRRVTPLTMDPATSARSALLRAMSRGTPLERMAPLVLTDRAGRPTGVVPVERLVERLADGPATADPAPLELRLPRQPR